MCRPRRTQISVGLPLETKLKSNIKGKHLPRIAIEESSIPIQNYREAVHRK